MTGEGGPGGSGVSDRGRGLRVHNELQTYQRDKTATRKEKTGGREEGGEWERENWRDENENEDHQIKLVALTTADAGVGKIRCFPRKQLPSIRCYVLLPCRLRLCSPCSPGRDSLTQPRGVSGHFAVN